MSTPEPSIKDTLGEDVLELMAQVVIVEAASSDTAKGDHRSLDAYHRAVELPNGEKVWVTLPLNPEVKEVVDRVTSEFWELFDRLLEAERVGDISLQTHLHGEILENKAYIALFNMWIKGVFPAKPLPFSEIIQNLCEEAGIDCAEHQARADEIDLIEHNRPRRSK